MIQLRLRSECDRSLSPFVVRISNGARQCRDDATLIFEKLGVLNYRAEHTEFCIRDVAPKDIAGDVLLIDPRRQIAHRLIRARSRHNTFLITEQCDQRCLMCSQPPKEHHQDMFEHFLSAARLAPLGAQIGLSGGEPLLHKQALFNFIDAAWTTRDDLSFHILTNGQHFDEGDLPWLRSHRAQLLWGVPIYSADAAIHDEIVGKPGAFAQLSGNFSLLGLAGAALELRTVVMKQNVSGLPDLADFITRYLPFAATWAIMQMERIGYGRMNWSHCFFDSSKEFTDLGAAIDLMSARRQSVVLYNFPLCTIPPVFRNLAAQSISDWKQKYLPECESCSTRIRCAGFFEWYREEDGFMGIHPQ
ncbi:His-Xaa-Ser system radical SAM maturase HxsC [Paracoccus alkanivorans]|uniref:His-Xaa-Ser system radical SAM maturase HxsC n=1 Tax=Paracoccus alkanivorans TaxID=2116655 RepID=A0A3M0M3T3_9RHOB|nr:His-Xaa-Ser system radical SAM maturase HxsC [Paracoccus alkanivorans]RMC30110.1 His-Xaa-Ser system radical SAM maturase HxsC [Paracoccus alkanivorans]